MEAKKPATTAPAPKLLTCPKCGTELVIKPAGPRWPEAEIIVCPNPACSFGGMSWPKTRCKRGHCVGKAVSFYTEDGYFRSCLKCGHTKKVSSEGPFTLARIETVPHRPLTIVGYQGAVNEKAVEVGLVIPTSAPHRRGFICALPEADKRTRKLLRGKKEDLARWGFHPNRLIPIVAVRSERAAIDWLKRTARAKVVVKTSIC